MPGDSPVDDPWVGQQSVVFDVSEIEDCAIAVDATYYIQTLLDTSPSHEPLMSALAGLTSLHVHINNDLDKWQANRVTPFFIFDGMPLVGQEEVTIATGIRDIAKTDAAWGLYFGGRANDAVSAFGATGATMQPQLFYPLLQKILRERKLHFLVAPTNAAAQIAYLDRDNSDQCAGIMGSQELLLYPIHDCVIRSIDWDNKTVLAMSKKQIVKLLNLSDYLFVDALLMTGTSFLPPFPPLRDTNITPRTPSVIESTNMLRASEKNINTMCASFNDILKVHDADWLDKFRKARLAINHFIYISESGEVCVNERDKLTTDNLAYIGLQLPAELYHYLNTGLVGPRLLTWLSYEKVTVLPTVDGYVTEEYRQLVTKQLLPYRETALSLIVPRMNRGFHYRHIALRVWYDDKYTGNVNHRNQTPAAFNRIAVWNNVTQEMLDKFFPKASSRNGSIVFELEALSNKEFLQTILDAGKAKAAAKASGKPPAVKNKPIEAADTIVSLTLWKLLTLRGHVNETTLELTPWGVALAKTVAALAPVAKKYPDFEGIYPAALLGLELIRLGLLTSKNQHTELPGEAGNGTSEEKSRVSLVSRTATLLQLRQGTNGYTGPLSKSLLNFHSLTTTVAEANRDLLEALLAILFMSGQAQRERSDYWDISHRLPFYEYPDVALGIAMKTYLDETMFDETEEARETRRKEFPAKYVPCAVHLYDDLDVAFGMTDALAEGVQTLGDKDLSAEIKADWAGVKKFIAQRR